MEEIQTNNSSKKIITREPEDNNVKEKIENSLVSKNSKISSNSKSAKKENIHNEKSHRSKCKSKSKSKSKSRSKTKQSASKSAIKKELNIDPSNNASKTQRLLKPKLKMNNHLK